MFVFFILILLFVVAPSPVTANSPITLAAYWRKAEQTRAIITALENEPGENSSAQLTALADEWAAITLVALPNGTHISVDHTFLAAQLKADPPNLPQLKARLDALLAARASWPHPKHTPTDIKAIEGILAQPEFQWRPEQPSLLAVLWQKILQFLWEWLSPLMPGRALITLNGAWFSYILTGLTTLLLGLVLFYMLRGLLADLVAEAELDVDPDTGQQILTADSALKRAQALSSAGDYRAAVRYLYLSSLLLLDERGLLRYNRWQTNREYLRSVAHLPQLAVILRDVIDVFDRVWYGYQPLDEATYSQYAAKVAQLREQK
jgi:hypothetical protein